MSVIAVEQLASELDRLAASLESAPLEGPLAAMVPALQEGFLRNFAAQVGSEGCVWPSRRDQWERGAAGPRSSYTGGGHELLNDTGALLGATQQGGGGNVFIVAARELAMGVDKGVQDGGIPGAAVHNFGYPARNIPQREYLYASEETLDRMAEVFADELLITIFGG